MALSGGHWKNLAECQKLTQPYIIPGVVETDIKRNNPLDLFSLVQANHTGEKIQWLRENTTAEGAVSNLGIGGQTLLTEDIEYTEKETYLRMNYIFRKLNKYVQSIYGTYNNYEQIKLKEIIKGVKRAVGAAIIYDDYTYDANSLQMDGLHALAAEAGTSTDYNIDATDIALSLAKWRQLYYGMKHGVDFWLIPVQLQKRIDAAYQEVGFTSIKADTAGTMGGMSWGQDEAGKPIKIFMNAPLIYTDYLVLEDAGTGAGSNARSTGVSAARLSLFGVKLGRGTLAEAVPGLRFLFGKTEENGEFFDIEPFDKLEGFKAKALRVSTMTALLLGSPMALGRIYDFTDAAITA